MKETKRNLFVVGYNIRKSTYKMNALSVANKKHYKVVICPNIKSLLDKEINRNDMIIWDNPPFAGSGTNDWKFDYHVCEKIKNEIFNSIDSRVIRIDTKLGLREDENKVIAVEYYTKAVGIINELVEGDTLINRNLLQSDFVFNPKSLLKLSDAELSERLKQNRIKVEDVFSYIPDSIREDNYDKHYNIAMEKARKHKGKINGSTEVFGYINTSDGIIKLEYGVRVEQFMSNMCPVLYEFSIDEYSVSMRELRFREIVRYKNNNGEYVKYFLKY